jgi:aminodeoxychorismate synthase component I
MVAPLLSFALDEWIDPADAFVALFGHETHAFWLDSGPDAAHGVSYLGAASANSRIAYASVADQVVTVSGCSTGASPETYPGRILDFLRADDAARRSPLSGQNRILRPNTEDERPGRSSIPGGVPDHREGFRLGWVGWLGYEAGADALDLPVRAAAVPDAALLFVDRAIVFDHAARTVTLLALDNPDAREWAARTATSIHSIEPSTASRLIAAAAAKSQANAPIAAWLHDDSTYLQLIAECQSRIAEGDAYQLCLTNQVRVAVQPDPLVAFLTLRKLNPSHHSGFFRFGDYSLLSSSPEQFLSVTQAGLIETKPIKGTRPRGESLESDLVLRAELVASEKERAENVMIVDLMRNDVGRVSLVGSVEVSELLAVESYAEVHQLVSTVRGQLAPDLTWVDAVAACFPAGSMTGAPKLSAMRILHALEKAPRGVYAGCFGYFGVDGAIDLAMVIRSIVLDGAGATIGAGGGITALSDAAEELAEMKLKASVLLRVLGIESEG